MIKIKTVEFSQLQILIENINSLVLFYDFNIQ